MLQPVCRRTWAPRGQTPILRQWDRRDRLSTISALTVAPRRRIVVEWLPPYAPDLNPVEHVWGHTKYGDLANFTPDTLPALEHAVLTSLAHTRGQQYLLAAFFRAGGLEL